MTKDETVSGLSIAVSALATGAAAVGTWLVAAGPEWNGQVLGGTVLGFALTGVLVIQTVERLARKGTDDLEEARELGGWTPGGTFDGAPHELRTGRHRGRPGPY